MAIKKVYSTSSKPKEGWKWDAKKKRSWSYGFDVRLADGTRSREAGFLKEEDALAAVTAIRRAEKENKYDLPRTRKLDNQPLLAELIEAKLPTLPNKKTRVRANTTLNRFLQIVEQTIAQPKVTDVTTALMWTYINTRLREGIKPESVNREMNDIASALHAAGEFFPALKDWQCPRIARPKVSKRRRERVITVEESARLLTYLHDPQKKETDRTPGYYESRLLIGQILHFALLTGARLGEIFKLRWEHIDFSANSIKIVDWKTDGERYIEPMPPSLIKLLRDRLKHSKSDFVFTLSGSFPKYFYEILKTSCEACGIKYGTTNGGIRFHDTRHTVTTRLLQDGNDIKTVQSFTGHSDETMVLLYSHVSKHSRAKAAETIENSLSWSKNGQNK